ncbi:MAG: threonylcarbamoyl-AMP synthase [Bifidobacteriaceae bacterium]|jgi:tRNA threonylcarbamoyl adenosine modification protein (Sua5/YciO/YrdC/YwlC family)|nr:threonylcarbamoyl-AMP synthase [Bifidobacteriaceae bacterium]
MLASVTGRPAPEVLADAAAAIARGELVVMPTDTVYGLAADPFDPAATARLFAVKQRPAALVLPVLVPDREAAPELADGWPDAAEALVQAFWPGPLTIILAARPAARLRLGGTPAVSTTVGLRQPDHPVALALLRATGPLAVTSANLTGHAPALTAADAARQFGDEAAVYVDAGPAPGGIASTVIDLGRSGSTRPRVVRAGAIEEDQLARALAQAIGRSA